MLHREPQDKHTARIRDGPGRQFRRPMKINHPMQTMPPFVLLSSPRAIDGDTIEASLVLWEGVTLRRRIRLRGFFAAEPTGLTAEQGRAAQQRLQAALDRHEAHLQTTGMREDRYGRLCARLWLGGRLTDPAEILGPHQMTEAAHQAQLHSR